MRLVRQFREYVADGAVRRVSADAERSKSLLAESERRMRSLKEKIEKLGVSDENANDYVEYCYDLLMHAVRASMIAEGYNASGQGAHEAEVAYLRVLNFSEADVQFADQLRYHRNGILYYGKSLDAEYAEKAISFVKKHHPKLVRLARRPS